MSKQREWLKGEPGEPARENRTKYFADAASVFQRLQYLSVPLVGVGDGVDTGAKHGKLTFGLKALIGDLYLDDLRDRTKRGLVGRKLAGYSTGGLPLGSARAAPRPALRCIPRAARARGDRSQEPRGGDAAAQPLGARRRSTRRSLRWCEGSQRCIALRREHRSVHEDPVASEAGPRATAQLRRRLLRVRRRRALRSSEARASDASRSRRQVPRHGW